MEPDFIFSYVASPYSHPNPVVREARYHDVMRAVHFLLHSVPGVHFSPIVYCHPLAIRYTLPTDAGYWQNFNEAIMERADRLYFVRLQGFDESVGCKMELDWAKKNGREYYFLAPTGGTFHVIAPA